MLIYKIISLLFALKVSLTSCGPEKRKSGFEVIGGTYKITEVGRLPAEVDESSGLVMARPGQSYWTHNDGGGSPALYEIDTLGRLLRTLPLKKVRNYDWEDLAKDEEGNLYVGEFGNNNNSRRDLKIYKFNPARPEKIDSITFRYEDQHAFPPEAKERNFDCEAFFWHADSLYLFSKNRGKKRVKLYVLPDQPGNYTAAIRGDIFIKSMVTSADINPSHTLFAVLTYGKVLLFKLNNGQQLLSDPYQCLKVYRNQAEAIAFYNDSDFMITNEQRHFFKIERKKK